jgi:hypothetical protein
MQLLPHVSRYSVLQSYNGCSSPVTDHLRLLYLKIPFANYLPYMNLSSCISLNFSPALSDNSHFPSGFLTEPAPPPPNMSGNWVCPSITPWSLNFSLANVTHVSIPPVNQTTTLFHTICRLKSMPTTCNMGVIHNSRTKSSPILFTYHPPVWVRAVTPMKRQPQQATCRTLLAKVWLFKNNQGQKKQRMVKTKVQGEYHFVATACCCTSELQSTSLLHLDAKIVYRAWKCELTNCSSTANFTRLADLQRHQSTVHRVGTPGSPCTVQGCTRVGNKGFTRRDHLVEHLRNFHHIDVPKRRSGERSAYPLGLMEHQ